MARVAAVAFLETFRQEVAPGDREALLMVARTSLRTKLAEALADQLTDIVTNAVLTIQKPDEPIDLYMVRCLTITVTISHGCVYLQPHPRLVRRQGPCAEYAHVRPQQLCLDPLLQWFGCRGTEGGAVDAVQACSCCSLQHAHVAATAAKAHACKLWMHQHCGCSGLEVRQSCVSTWSASTNLRP